VACDRGGVQRANLVSLLAVLLVSKPIPYLVVTCCGTVVAVVVVWVGEWLMAWGKQYLSTASWTLAARIAVVVVGAGCNQCHRNTVPADLKVNHQKLIDFV
jgi:hypothetical protein